MSFSCRNFSWVIFSPLFCLCCFTFFKLRLYECWPSWTGLLILFFSLFFIFVFLCFLRGIFSSYSPYIYAYICYHSFNFSKSCLCYCCFFWMSLPPPLWLPVLILWMPYLDILRILIIFFEVFFCFRLFLRVFPLFVFPLGFP